MRVYQFRHIRVARILAGRRLGRWLRELHMRHHFQDHERGYGISAPYWDRVFGTAVKRARGRERDGEPAASA